MKSLLLIFSFFLVTSFKYDPTFDFEGKLLLSITTNTNIIENELNDNIMVKVDNSIIKLNKNEVSGWLFKTKYLKHSGARITHNPNIQDKILSTWDNANNLATHGLSVEFKNGYINTITLKCIK